IGLFRIPDLKSIGIWVAVSFWIALLVVMVKLGNPSVPRIIAPYYPGILLLPLMFPGHARIIKSRWWRVSSFALLLPIVPALVFNPARPVIRLDKMAMLFANNPRMTPWIDRFNAVYSVYENRSDGHKPVRDLLPASAKTIGFAGTDGDSEYSFWLPLGTRRVRDFTPLIDRQPPSTLGLDAIVTSDWGCNDRFGMTPEQLAQKIGWRLAASVPIRRLAKHGEIRWSVLVPTETGNAD
ncbi:MAG: hypothetical protein WCH43_10485, partial [Verrucomicrobiota bacterium]